MERSLLFHQGNRELQDAFESRRIADRLESMARVEFSPDDKAYIENAFCFFLATADADGQPDCSFKGGSRGFVRVAGADELVFPDYDGNGMFKSLGNILANPRIGMLFIDFEKPRRLRVNGTARIHREDPLLAHTIGAQMIVRVKAHAIFPNCPRYIPRMEVAEPSPYVPRAGEEPLEPAWKSFPDFAPFIHPRQPTAR